jgi:hypothetical protein
LFGVREVVYDHVVGAYRWRDEEFEYRHAAAAGREREEYRAQRPYQRDIKFAFKVAMTQGNIGHQLELRMHMHEEINSLRDKRKQKVGYGEAQKEEHGPYADYEFSPQSVAALDER